MASAGTPFGHQQNAEVVVSFRVGRSQAQDGAEFLLRVVHPVYGEIQVAKIVVGLDGLRLKGEGSAEGVKRGRIVFEVAFDDAEQIVAFDTIGMALERFDCGGSCFVKLVPLDEL